MRSEPRASWRARSRPRPSRLGTGRTSRACRREITVYIVSRRVLHRTAGTFLQTPFAVGAAKEGYKFLGGKLDDVAVVCGVVRHGDRPPLQLLSNFDLK